MTSNRTTRGARLALALWVASSAARAQTQPAPVAPPAAPASSDRRDEALSHFELGLAHFDRGEWPAALAEFLEARALYPTRSATKNAAICLRKENRFDEALDMFEALIHDYPDLSAVDRALADDEIASLRRSVGTLLVRGADDGASVLVDGRARGTTPLAAPLRLGVGSHVVRVVKEGFAPYEERIDIASGVPSVLGAHLEPLLRSGRLRVVEQGGQTLDVVVDGTVVGKAPWEGAIAPGLHSVLLRGEGDVGTQPVEAPVSLDQVTPITLAAERLDSEARIDPTPSGALVAVDGVAVGRGVWDGRLRSGVHRVEVTADGFLPARQDVLVRSRQRERVTVTLDRDPTSPLWGVAARPHVTVELDGALGLGPTFGGEVVGACASPCSATVPLGGLGLLRASLQLPMGLAFGVEGGYLGLRQAVHDRATQVVGSTLLVPADNGTVDDTLTLSGLLLGASVAYRRGDAWPITFRASIGGYVASAIDDRNGSFRTSSLATTAPNTPYTVGVSASQGAPFLYVAPEVRLSRRVFEHVEVSAGIQLLVLPALSPARWPSDTSVLAAPAGKQGDGDGSFASQTLTGSVLVVFAPGLGARYEF